MAGTITALEYQKKDRNRVNVYLDGRFAFGLPAIVAAHLARGQSLSDAEIDALKAEGTVESAYNRALNYLSYRPRSRAEIETYVQGRGMTEDQVETIASRLERAGLLDDEAFAQFWVENRERFRPRGLYALRYELQNKGINEKIIDRVLASVDTSASAYRAAASKARQLGHLDQAMFGRKLTEYLVRRGFEYEVAREAVERHWAETVGSE
jgi:regulatory protein